MATFTISDPSSQINAKSVIVSNAYNATQYDSIDKIIYCSTNSFTVTLPDISSKDEVEKVIKNISDGTTIVVDGFNSQTIDGVLNINLTSQYETLIIRSFGGNWYIISSPFDNTRVL